MTAQKAVIQQVIEHIESNLDKELDLEAIAQAAGYSKFHLNRLFAKETGCTIYKYLQARRLTVAAEKLVKTTLPITQIAYDAGYNSQQAFTLAFKQLYIYPPKLYRERGVFRPKQQKITLHQCICSLSAWASLSERRAA